LASNGTGFAVGWFMHYPGSGSGSGTANLRVNVFDGGDAVTAGWGYSTAATGYAVAIWDLASDGAGYLASWWDCHAVFGSCSAKLLWSRYTTGGWSTPEPLTSALVPGTSDKLLLGGTAGGYHAVWSAAAGGVYASNFSGSWSAPALVPGTASLPWSGGLHQVKDGYALALSEWQSGATSCVAQPGPGGVYGGRLVVTADASGTGGCSFAVRAGELTALWSEGGHIHTRAVRNGALTAQERLSVGTGYLGTLGPRTESLAIADDGSAYAAWLQFDGGVYAPFGASYANKAWSAAVKLCDRADAVAVASDGTRFVVVYGGADGVYARVVGAGQPGAPAQLDPVGQEAGV
ncbi:MAG: hypothetical protein ACK4N5_26970, partial [Myxococcales bacterium]